MYKADFEEQRDRDAAADRKVKEMSALQSQYEQRIAKLESKLATAQESLEATYRQLKQDKTQNVWIVEHHYDCSQCKLISFAYYRIGWVVWRKN